MNISLLNQEVWRKVLFLAESAANGRMYVVNKKKSKCTKNLFDVSYSKNISENERIELYVQGWLFSQGLVLTRCRVYIYNKNIERKSIINNNFLKNYPFLDFNLIGLSSALEMSAYKEVEFSLFESEVVLEKFFTDCLDKIDAIENFFEATSTPWINNLISCLFKSTNENIGLNVNREDLSMIKKHYV